MSRPRLRLRPRGDGTVLSAGLVLTLLAAGVAAIAAEPGPPPRRRGSQRRRHPGLGAVLLRAGVPPQRGDQRWNVRNRPAGTVAAGYWHTDDALSDALTASARYQPLGAPDFGATEPTGRRLDVSYLAPDPLTARPTEHSWLSRTPGNQVEVTDRSRRGSATALSSVRSRLHLPATSAAPWRPTTRVWWWRTWSAGKDNSFSTRWVPTSGSPQIPRAHRRICGREVLRESTPMSATAHGTGPSATCTRRSCPLI